MAEQKDLRDAYGNPIQQGIYVDIKSDNPDLCYMFVISQNSRGFSFGKDCFPPTIPCMSRETWASWSVPLTPKLRNDFLERHGEPSKRWLDRQKEAHPELADIIEAQTA